MDNLNNLKELRDMQGKDGTIEQGDYMIGLYNGIELSIAAMEGREPIYKSCTVKTIE